MLINKPLILSTGTGAAPAHTIDQSIRFNDDDSAYMSRTPSSASNRKTFSFSCWLKLGSGTIDSGAEKAIFSARDGSTDNYSILSFNGDQSGANQLEFVNRSSSYAGYIYTTQLFRDPSAWYHIVLNVDTTDAISSERIKLYVNGSRVTDVTYSAPTLNLDMNMNNNIATAVGARPTNNFHFDGYLAEIVFIDGQALDPSSFGEYNDSNIWIPKDVSGLTFGTNGFHIDGRDASGTPVKLGDDEAGSNNFTTSNMNAHDQVADSPTNNFSTLNPLIPGLGLTTVTYSEGNLKVTFSNNDATESTIGIPSSGKWYFEGYVIDTTYFRDDVQTAIGLRPEGFSHQRDDVNETGFAYGQNGKKIEGDGSSGSASSYGASYSADDIIGVAVDMDASPATLTFYKNNTSQGTAFTFTDKTIFRFGSVAQRNSSGWILNFGQDSTFVGENVNANDYSNYVGASDGNGVGSFFYTPPTGHLALCTKNLGS